MIKARAVYLYRITISAVFCVVFAAACTSFYEDYDKKILENKEFDEQVKITEIEPPPEEKVEAAPTPPSAPGAKPSAKAPVKPAKPAPGKAAAKVEAPVATPPAQTQKHLPSIEDGEGFNGRQPIVNPFVVGENSEFSVSYFGVEAGKFTMAIKPFVEVNGKKSYHFSYHARSSSVFSVMYSVDDRAEAYLDVEKLVPYSYTISARESKQIRDVKSYFNWKTKIAKTWDKKIKKGKDPEIKEYQWEMDDYAQNVFTVAFYLRCFTLRTGKKLAVHVAHEGKNIIMRADVVREEKLHTAVGELDTFVIKPSFEIEGVFKPVGDVFFWVTKDDRKRIVRLESKIKIGKIVATVEKMTP